MFSACRSLISVDLTNCEILEAGTFNYCTKLPSINLPRCSYIGGGAFAYCNSLEYLDAPACISMGSTTSSGFVDTGGFFRDCYKLTSFNIPGFSSLTSLGTCLFRCCYSLSLPSLNLSKMTYIGREALAYCSVIAPSITSLDLPELEFLGSSAFAGSYEISHISFPKLKTLGGNIMYTNMTPDLSHRILMPSVYLPQCQNLSYSAF